jgi:hypothetical protein
LEQAVILILALYAPTIKESVLLFPLRSMQFNAPAEILLLNVSAAAATL